MIETKVKNEEEIKYLTNISHVSIEMKIFIVYCYVRKKQVINSNSIRIRYDWVVGGLMDDLYVFFTSL